MKSLSVALQAHLDGQLSKLVTCIRVTRTDAVVYGFTNHDKLVNFGGLDYLPAAGFNPTDIASNLNLDTDNVSVEGLLADDSITEDDLRAGRWDFAAFRIFQINWSDLSQGDKKDRAGNLGEVTVHRQTFVAELLGLMDAFSTSVGEITTPACRANLGDARCQVDVVPFTVTGTITTGDADFFTLHDAARNEANDYFNEGVITFTSGDNDGLSYEIKSSTAAGVLVTKMPMAYNAAGASYSLVAGCDRRLETCRDRFANVVNFRGEPWLRGNDAAVAIGRHS